MPSSVLLPAPLGPRTAATWPGRNSSDTSIRARWRPYVFSTRSRRNVALAGHQWMFPQLTRVISPAILNPRTPQRVLAPLRRELVGDCRRGSRTSVVFEECPMRIPISIVLAASFACSFAITVSVSGGAVAQEQEEGRRGRRRHPAGRRRPTPAAATRTAPGSASARRRASAAARAPASRRAVRRSGPRSWRRKPRRRRSASRTRSASATPSSTRSARRWTRKRPRSRTRVCAACAWWNRIRISDSPPDIRPPTRPLNGRALPGGPGCGRPSPAR